MRWSVALHGSFSATGGGPIVLVAVVQGVIQIRLIRRCMDLNSSVYVICVSYLLRQGFSDEYV